MTYSLYVEDGGLADRVPGYLRETYGLESTNVLLVERDSESPFGWELTVAPAVGGVSELEFTRRLCGTLGVRALIDPGTPYPDRWVLVTRDGSHGWVHTDEDGSLRIEYALEPIAGELDLEVRTPPDWAS